MNRPPRRRRDFTPAFLAAGFLALAVIVGVTFWFTAQLRRDAVATQAVLVDQELISLTEGSVRQAETGQRGYLLTGNRAYLAQYAEAVPAVPLRLKALDGAVGDDGLNPQDVADLTGLADAKMAELARTVELYRTGQKAAALAVVNTNYGENVMDELRALVIRMHASQYARLAQLRQADMRDTRLLDAFIAAAATFTILFALGAVAASVARTRRLMTTEAALTAANLGLGRKVAELDRIFRLSTDLLAVLEPSGVFRNVSPAWTQITGISEAEALGAPLARFVHPEDVADTAAALARLSTATLPGEFETRLRNVDGGYRWLAWRAVALPSEALIFVVARDVTDERAREERLRQTQKMEVVGQLTGGIAHDFNNLLTIIMGSLELLRRGLDGSAPRLLARADNALEAARRAASLTHRLLAFSRRQPLKPVAVDINRLAAGMSDMLHRTLGEVIATEVVAGAGLWWALADGNQLENALLNLAVNARDAMPGGGKLTLETRNAYLDEAYAERRLDVKAGQYVEIAVTDTGAGMAPEVLDKVFEPFFTTKPFGQGTGLGLAQVYGFVKQSSGHIAVYSELGHGTTVKLYLPRAPARVEAEPAQPLATPSASPRGRGETILLVEDEAGVRAFAAEVLREHGYNVLEAETGPAALDLFNGGNSVALLFTDVVLAGGMTGRVLADLILARSPHIPVLFTTGYTRNAIIHDGKLDEGIHFIGKPFTSTEVATKIRRLLDQATVPASA